MPDLFFLPALLAFFVAAASPGPATLAVSATAMAQGARPAVALGLGLAVGLAFWGVVAAAGLGALLTQSATALTALRWFGAVYLFWLAWQSARSALGPRAAEGGATSASGTRLMVRGLLLNLSNPKAVLAWISVLALGIGAEADGTRLVLTTGLCSVTGLVIYLVYAVAFAQAPIRAGYRRGQKAIDGLAAGFFGYSGARLLIAQSPASP